MSQSRQLAAIMFTDIVGYTALMGEDEQKAFKILNKSRQLQKPLIEQYGGRFIKELGDGVLAVFTTVTESVLCAITIQNACNNIQSLKLRIGIHLGEIVFEDNDVFGDGVNIASRLQALAPIGGIWISDSVYKNVSNKREIQTKFVREEILKNVREPVQVYEVLIDQPFSQSESPIKAEPPIKRLDKSIAVLPFVDMSAAHDQEYLGDGLAEEILNSLVPLKDLKVAGRTSSFQFKGKNIDLRDVGEKLGVTTVLEESVRKQGNRLRITAQLINVENGFHLWSQKFDREMDDIFAIQDEIALAITDRLKITLLQKDREQITKIQTQNAEAYELYLKGMLHVNRRGSSALIGLQYFEQAIALDPEFALAYTGYAFANFLIAFYSYAPGKEIMKKMKQAVDTALRIDNSRSETYLMLGQYYIGLEWNWREAEKNYLKAIELNPSFAQPHALYGMACLTFFKGKFDEGEKYGRIAIKLEPLSAIDHADLAWTLYTSHKFDEALAVAKTGIELDANSFLSQRLAGLCYLALKRYSEAIDTFEHLINISNRNQHAINSLIWVYCIDGDGKKANGLMNELNERSEKEYIARTNYGLSAAWLGDIDTALKYLENAYQDHDPILMTLRYSPYVPTSLRSDPRFQNLLERIGFP